MGSIPTDRMGFVNTNKRHGDTGRRCRWLTRDGCSPPSPPRPHARRRNCPQDMRRLSAVDRLASGFWLLAHMTMLMTARAGAALGHPADQEARCHGLLAPQAPCRDIPTVGAGHGRVGRGGPARPHSQALDPGFWRHAPSLPLNQGRHCGVSFSQRQPTAGQPLSRPAYSHPVALCASRAHGPAQVRTDSKRFHLAFRLA